jgi:hypothetical protein
MDRDKLVEAWKRYGETYNVFVPDEQPTPKGEGWDRPMPEPTESGTLDPQLMKHWRFFAATRNFLRQRYAEHGILQSPALTFDCLVPKYQKPMKASVSKKGKRKKKGDPEEWYAGAVRMLMTVDGEVGFTCQSKECLRTHCKLNLQNPKRMSRVDLYSLIQIFHGYRSAAKAKQIVAEAFEIRLGKFEFKDVEQRPLIKRCAVPKWAIHELIQKFSDMRRQEVRSLVDYAVDLIETSQVVELAHGRVFSHYFAFLWPQITENEVLQKINGPAIRLYLWLLVEQEERARRNDFNMRLTDAEIARSLGISRKTAGIYRQDLEKLGLLKVKEGIWTVGYTPKSQRNTQQVFKQ